MSPILRQFRTMLYFYRCCHSFGCFKSDYSFDVSLIVDKDDAVNCWTEAQYRGEQINNEIKMLHWINKFHSIKFLSLVNGTDDVIQLNNVGWGYVKPKIQSGDFRYIGLPFSRETLLNFLKRFKLVQLKKVILDPSDLNDEFFSVLSENGTSVWFDSMDRLEVPVTNETLTIISKKYIPMEIFLSGLLTDITFNGIRKIIEAALNSGTAELQWDFGYLKKEQYRVVQTFFNEEFEEFIDRLKVPLYFKHENNNAEEIADITSEDDESFEILHREKSENEFSISFTVVKPEEPVIQRDEEMNEESDEEGSIEY